jgi:hypothetical protein
MGEPKQTTPAEDEHGYVAMNVGIALGSYVKANDLGQTCAAETGFLISRTPDIVRRTRR